MDEDITTYTDIHERRIGFTCVFCPFMHPLAFGPSLPLLARPPDRLRARLPVCSLQNTRQTIGSPVVHVSAKSPFHALARQ